MKTQVLFLTLIVKALCCAVSVFGQDFVRSTTPYVYHTKKFVDVFPRTRNSIIQHLLNDGIHKGKFKKAQLEQLSEGELLALHSDDHSNVVDYNALSTIMSVQQDPVVIEPRPAVVIVSVDGGEVGCSGVCFHPVGLIMTAKHCGEPKKTKVWFPTLGNLDATLVYSSPEAEGPIVYRIARAGDYPYLRVADSKADVGIKVTFCGYPKLKKDRYFERQIALKGSKEFVINKRNAVGILTASKPYTLNIADEPIIKGMSGGPLLDEKQEIIGLASVSDSDRVESGWISHKAIRIAYESLVDVSKKSVKLEGKPTVVIFSVPNCLGCMELERDINRGLFVKYNCIVVKHQGGVWQQSNLVSEYQKHTGQNLYDKSFPLLWVRGSKYQYSGYSSASSGGICHWLENAVAAVFGATMKLGKTVVDGTKSIIVGKPAPLLAPPPYPLPIPRGELLPEPPSTTIPEIKVPEVEEAPTPIVILREPELVLPEIKVPPEPPNDPAPLFVPIEINPPVSSPLLKLPEPPATVPPIPVVPPAVILPNKVELVANSISMALFISQTTPPAARLPIEGNRGVFERRSNELFKGIIKLDIVTEKAQKNLFTAVVNYARVKPDPSWMLVLVKDLSIKSKPFLDSKLIILFKNLIPENTPIEIVFEQEETLEYRVFDNMIKNKDLAVPAVSAFQQSLELNALQLTPIEPQVFTPSVFHEKVSVPEVPSQEILAAQVVPNIDEVKKEAVAPKDIFIDLICAFLALLGFEKIVRVVRIRQAVNKNKEIDIQLEKMTAHTSDVLDKDKVV